MAQQYQQPMAGPAPESQGPPNPPFIAPDPAMAKRKIHSSFMQRQGTDKAISTHWTWLILLFQVIVPASAIISLYAVLTDASFDITNMGFLLLLFLAALLISIALAVTHAIVASKLVARRDGHFRRDAVMRDGMMDHMNATSYSTKIDLNVERWTLNTIHYSSQTSDRSPGLWAVMVALIGIIPIFGTLLLMYFNALMTKDVHEHDEKQRYFIDQFQRGMAKAGRPGDGASNWHPLPVRNISMYAVLSVLTLGFFLPYWWYVNIVDMNTHIANQWNFENELVKTIQAEG
jgi:hypothetical protein